MVLLAVVFAALLRAQDAPIPFKEAQFVELAGDGSRAVLAIRGGGAKSANPVTGVVGAQLDIPDPALGIVLTFDGKRAVVWSSAMKAWLRVFETDSGRLISSGTISSGAQAVAISDNGRIVAASDATGTIRFLEADSGKELSNLKSTGVGGMSVSPDGAIAAIPVGTEIQLVDPKTGKATSTLKMPESKPDPGNPAQKHGASITRFSPDGKFVLSNSGRPDGTLLVWTLSTKSSRAVACGIAPYPRRLVFSSDGKRALAAEMERGSYRLVDLEKGEIIGDYPVGTQPGSMAFSADGKHVLYALPSGVHRFGTSGVGRCERFMGASSRADAEHYLISVSADGRFAAVGGEIWDLGKGICALTINAGILALSPSGKEFIRSDPGRIAKVYDAATGKELRDLPGQKGESPSVALFSSDGKLVVLGSQAAIVAVDFLAGKELQRWKGRALGENIAFRRDGKMIATVDPGKGTVRILNVETGAEKDAGLKAKSAINAITWSHDGSRIASAGSDGSISVWESDSGKLSKEVGSGGALMAGGVTFSPDGKLFGALKDNSVTIWDAETWKELSRVAPTDRSFLFLPDGKRIVSSWGPSLWRVRE